MFFISYFVIDIDLAIVGCVVCEMFYTLIYLCGNLSHTSRPHCRWQCKQNNCHVFYVLFCDLYRSCCSWWLFYLWNGNGQSHQNDSANFHASCCSFVISSYWLCSLWSLLHIVIYVYLHSSRNYCR